MYVILGLFSPELILAIAFSEWRDASRVLLDAQRAGAVAYAKTEIELVLKKLPIQETNEPWEIRVRNAVIVTRAAAETATLNTKNARIAAAEIRKDTALYRIVEAP